MQKAGQRKQILILLLAALTGCLTLEGAISAAAASTPHSIPAAKAAAPGHANSSHATSTSSSSFVNGPSRSLQEAQQSTVPCKQNPNEPLSKAITSCLNWQQPVGCAFLEAQGYIAGGAQPITPDALTGDLSAPDVCGSSTVSVKVQQQQQQQQQLRFDVGSRAVLAVIAKGPGSSVFFFGTGASKGLISLQQQPSSLELCLSPPGEGSVQAQQTAAYTQRLAAGSVTWQLRKSVQLPPAFADGVVQMIQGDTVEAAWTLSATKSGEEASFQGVVSGSISITNSKPVPVTVYGVLTAVKGGPSAVVNCGPSMPFEIPACTTTVCSFTARHAQPPAAGRYAASTTVQYQEYNRARVAVAQVQTAFEVPKAAAALAPRAQQIPTGQAVVTDTQLPGQVMSFTGTGQQSYVTTLTCPPSGSVFNSATLLAATGQEVTAAANVQKNCHKLDVRLAAVGEPVVARWHWSISQVSSASHVSLRSASAMRDDFARRQQLQGSNITSQLLTSLDAADGNAQLPTTEDVTYTVRVTRSLPKGADGKVAPFTITGKVVVTNPSPINAKLAGVTIRVTDPDGTAAPVSIAASCPLLAVASGQSLTCSWTATPAFNPIGGSVTAFARYVATRNGGGPSGDFVDFESAPVTVGDATTDAVDEAPDGWSTFGGTFLAPTTVLGSIKRSLLQWAGGMTSSAPTFNPAAFLSRVWGNTGANTIITPLPPATFAPGAALPAVQAHPTLYRAPAPSNSFAAPAPLTALPGTPAEPAQTEMQQRAAPQLGTGFTTASMPAVFAAQQQAAAKTAAQGTPSNSKVGFSGSAGSKESWRQASSGSSQGVSKGSAARATVPAAAAVDPHRRVSAPTAAPAAAGAPNMGSAEAAAVSAVSAAEPMGLLDDCADISHELGFEPGLLPGRVVSGKAPSGRICSSSVFVYSVRYGPYESCGTGTKAAAAVRLMTGDTRRVRSSLAELDVSVRGCKAGLEAVVAAAHPTADVAASWDMRMHAERWRLQLQPGQTVNNSYTVSYDRRLLVSAPRLFVVISLRNTGHSTPLIGDASYSVNVTCGAQTHVRSNAFACASHKVAPGGSANCSFVVPLPCAAKGLLQAQLQLSTGQTVRTPVTEFAAPDLDQLVAMEPSRSACVKASYKGAGHNGKHKPGKLVAGQLPRGTLCQPQSFTFTRQFGPYSNCGEATGQVSAGFRTAAGVVRSEALLTTLDVTGCSSSSTGSSTASGSGSSGTGSVSAGSSGGGKATPAASAGMPASSRLRLSKQHQSKVSSNKASAKPAGPAMSKKSNASSSKAAAAAAASSDPQEKLVQGSCVYQPWFWKHCMLPDLPGEAACDVIITSLPGGQGPRTPFFPYRKSPKIRRTYRQLLVAPKKTGNKIVDLHFHAAKVFIATQLNQYAGVVMPPLVKAAYIQLGREYFSVYDDRSAAEMLPSKPQVLQQVAAAAKVLADFTSGKLPGYPTCASVKKQLKQNRPAGRALHQG